MLRRSAAADPLRAAAECLIELASRYETEESLGMDRLLRSSDALRLRKDAAEMRIERRLADAMAEVWPGSARRDDLRVVATIATGVLRLALEDWRADGDDRPLAAHLRRLFGTLDARLTGPRPGGGPATGR